MKLEDIDRVLFRLGERVERAEIAHNIAEIVDVDRRLEAIAIAYPEVWIQPVVIRGQNNIRKFHHLEELHV